MVRVSDALELTYYVTLNCGLEGVGGGRSCKYLVVYEQFGLNVLSCHLKVMVKFLGNI